MENFNKAGQNKPYFVALTNLYRDFGEKSYLPLEQNFASEVTKLFQMPFVSISGVLGFLLYDFVLSWTLIKRH